jgi:ligand-binding sensor domain-containing protein
VVAITREVIGRTPMTRTPLIAAVIVLTCGAYAFALNPGLDISQYAHTAWSVNRGFAKGRIRSVTQSVDGYLWLATEFGVLRFDGVRTINWEPPSREALPSTDIRSLRWARDGTFWIGTYRGLVSWNGRTLTRYPELDGQVIEAVLEDREGTLWVVAGWTLSESSLCRVQNGRAECYGRDDGAGAQVTTVYEDSEGVLWAGAMTGVWRWKPGPPGSTRSPVHRSEPTRCSRAATAAS